MKAALWLGVGLFLTAGGAAAQDPVPYVLPDRSDISISGTVASTSPDSFGLNYGEGVVNVEVDTRIDGGERLPLEEGDTVTVYGVIDDGLFELNKIEASRVEVQGEDLRFEADPADEEDRGRAGSSLFPGTLVDDGDGPGAGIVSISGTVRSVTGREMTLDTEPASFTVDTREMETDPFAPAAPQRIEVGDVVRATGHIDRDFFESRELVAHRIETLSEAERAR